MDIGRMLEEIHKIIAKCSAPERDVYEALCIEAEGWQMRLEELEGDDEKE